MARKFEVGSGKSIQPVAKKVSAKPGPIVKPRPQYNSTYTYTGRVVTPCDICGVTSSATGGYCPPHKQEFDTFLKLLGSGMGTNGQLFKIYRDLLDRISVLEDALEIKRIKEMYE